MKEKEIPSKKINRFDYPVAVVEDACISSSKIDSESSSSGTEEKDTTTALLIAEIFDLFQGRERDLMVIIFGQNIA